MAESAKADLMRALGRMARGLSALFWGIPLALIAGVETARTDWTGFIGPAGFGPVLVLTLGLWHGVRQLGDFQKQERVWQQALARAEFLAIINAGLAPFLFWWHRFPAISFYTICVEALALAGLLFLLQLNQVLRRLGAMLPDETLRADTQTFTGLNTGLLAAVLVCALAYAAVNHGLYLQLLHQQWVERWRDAAVRAVLFLALIPVATTLAMLWKIKESIFAGIFNVE